MLQPHPAAMNPTLRKSLKRLGLVVFVSLALALLSLLAGSFVNLSGRSLMRLADWQEWQVHHYWYFLIARVVLFSFVAGGWVWFRSRTLQARPAFLDRLKKAEITAALGILMIELIRIGALWESLI